jgi:hypothetical protein
MCPLFYKGTSLLEPTAVASFHFRKMKIGPLWVS